jgi:hypothetical protein
MVLEDEQPPQTIRQAMTEGWQALVVECWPCSWPREGRLMFRDFDEWCRAWRLAHLFARAKCGRCGRRPKTARLAVSQEFQGLTSWHERPVLFVDGYVVRPGRW